MNLMEMEPGLATTISGGPRAMERPDTDQSIMIDLMGNGAVIEKNPQPVASIMASGVAAEAILQRLSETEAEPGYGSPEDDAKDRFEPYALTGDPAEIYGGIQVIGGDIEGANAFIRKLIGSVERPEDEEQATDTRNEAKRTDDDQEASRGSAAILALRRSRLGKLIAGTAVVAYGALNWASSASGETLEQECVTAGMKPMQIIVARIHGVHRQNGNGWHALVKGKVDPMPQECIDNGYHRVFNSEIDMQNGEHPQRYSMIIPSIGARWNGRANGYGFVFDDGAPGYRVGGGNISYQHNHNWTKFAYMCRPGPEKTQVRYKEENTVVHVDGTISDYGSTINGNIEVLDNKFYKRPLDVVGAC